MPDLTLNGDPANNMGVSDLIWEVRRERRVEMMYCMNDRYWSLIRWHQLDKLDQNQYPDNKLGAYAAGLSGVEVDANGYINTCIEGTVPLTYEAKYYLYPIPTNEISLNENIGQNYGW